MGNKNFKPKRGLGSAVTRQRRRVAEQVRASADARHQAEKAAARAEIARALAASKNEFQNKFDRFGDSLLSSVVYHQTAVMRSMGFRQNVNAAVTPHANIVAYTDFKSVTIQWPRTLLPKVDSRREEILNTICKMKGLVRHEHGHLQYTTPFPTILANVVQRNESRPAAQQRTKHELHMAWNCLEDQRMERLSVQSIPRLKNYFIPLVGDVIMGVGKFAGDVNAVQTFESWLLVAGRDFMPDDLRTMSYDMFNTYGQQFANMANASDRWFDIVQRYIAASDHQSIYDIALEAADFVHELHINLPQMDDHSKQGNDDSNSPADSSDGLSDDKNPGKGKGQGKSKGDDGDGDEDGAGKGKGKSKDGSKSKDKLPPGAQVRDDYNDRGLADHSYDPNKAPDVDSMDEDDEWQDAQSNAGNGGHTFTPEQLLDKVRDTVTEALSTARNDHDVQEMIQDAFSLTDKTGLKEYEGSGVLMPDKMLSDSLVIAGGIEQALQSFVTQSAPMWHNRVNKGVIDALAYRTKEIGSQAFHRHLEDLGNTGLDVHVSILADVSYSMQGYMGDLSKFMYAAGIACRNLGIGATFTLWSSGSENYRIWGRGISPEVFPAMGGTDPTEALDDLTSHNPEDAAHHLVLIFTDGAWASNFPTLQRWGADNRTLLFIRFGAGAASGLQMGADRAVAINNLMELPEQLTLSLIDVLSAQMGPKEE